MELTSYIVEKAIEILDGGWCKHRYYDAAGNHCTIGAMRRAIYPEYPYQSVDYEVLHDLDVELGKRLNLPVQKAGDPEEFRSVPAWNDGIDMTKEKVIDALTEVAKGLRNEGK